MLAGKFKLKLDQAGRCTIPSKLRKGLGNEIIISAGLDRCECLNLYHVEAWEQLQRTLFPTPHPRNFRREVLHTMRYLGSSAELAELDNNNRVVIPAELRERAGLRQEVVIIGAMDHAEIWDADRWEAYEQQLITEETQEMIRAVLTEPQGEVA